MDEINDRVRETVVEERKNTVLTRAESVIGGVWYNLYAKKKEPLQTNIVDRSSAYKMLEKADAFYRKQLEGVM